MYAIKVGVSTVRGVLVISSVTAVVGVNTRVPVLAELVSLADESAKDIDGAWYACSSSDLGAATMMVAVTGHSRKKCQTMRQYHPEREVDAPSLAKGPSLSSIAECDARIQQGDKSSTLIHTVVVRSMAILFQQAGKFQI